MVVLVLIGKIIFTFYTLFINAKDIFFYNLPLRGVVLNARDMKLILTIFFVHCPLYITDKMIP